ncbi:unnamed protein product, partial [marine sediment metagenome]
MQNKIRSKSISYTNIPTYILGPFIIEGEYAKGKYDVPFTITEKPIIPSLNRGRKVINLNGGAKT